MFNQNDLIRSIRTNINIEGYDFLEEEQGVFLKKIIDNRTLSIYIGYNGYPDRYFLQHPIATISFNLVDDIISKIDIPQRFITNKYTCRFVYDENINSSGIPNVPIMSEVDFKQVENLILPIIDDIIVFFNKHQELKDVTATLNGLEMKRAVEFLGQPFPLRKMGLLFFTNLNDYKDFSERVITSYKESNSPLLEPVLNLTKVLESTPPS